MNLTNFVSGGVQISNPFLDETGRCEADRIHQWFPELTLNTVYRKDEEGRLVPFKSHKQAKYFFNCVPGEAVFVPNQYDAKL